MEPKAIRNHSMRRGSDGLLRLVMVDADREFVLDPLAEFIWDLADGSRDIDVLAEAASRAFDRVVEQEQIFSALDFLADAGLIEERVAPPAAETKVSRRSVLSRIVPVAGAAAWMMSGGSAKAAGLFQTTSPTARRAAIRSTTARPIIVSRATRNPIRRREIARPAIKSPTPRPAIAKWATKSATARRTTNGTGTGSRMRRKVARASSNVQLIKSMSQSENTPLFESRSRRRCGPRGRNCMTSSVTSCRISRSCVRSGRGQASGLCLT